jgi:uncharacterized repeat protein (TIGR04138 family)
MSHPKLDELLQRDSRYPFEAYEFVFNALAHTQRMLDRLPEDDPRVSGPTSKKSATGERQHHVSGPELLEGVRDLALREFGLLARTVFRMWGINATDDIGEIVFNLIDAELMSQTNEDRKSDFHNVYDMDRALTEGYQILGSPQVEDDL